MFSVLFEVLPKADQSTVYLNSAEMLRTELHAIDGFVDNVLYRSPIREGWILSFSNWRDEKAVVRWRANVRHYEVQGRGRANVLLDYHLRVGQITKDTHVPVGYALREQRLDETEVGEGTTVTLIEAKRRPEWKQVDNPAVCAELLGLSPFTGFTSWDIFEAVLTPNDLLLMLTWQDNATAEDFESSANLPDGARLLRVRIVRDYGMYDRREAPQYHADCRRQSTMR